MCGRRASKIRKNKRPLALLEVTKDSHGCQRTSGGRTLVGWTLVMARATPSVPYAEEIEWQNGVGYVDILISKR